MFGVSAAVIASDPESLLWTPGQKLISIPSVMVSRNSYLTIQQITEGWLIVLNDNLTTGYRANGYYESKFRKAELKIGNTAHVHRPEFTLS